MAVVSKTAVSIERTGDQGFRRPMPRRNMYPSEYAFGIADQVFSTTKPPGVRVAGVSGKLHAGADKTAPRQLTMDERVRQPCRTGDAEPN
jgi:hypothetical protein